MSLQNIQNTETTTFGKVFKAIKDMQKDISRLKSMMSRDVLRARGYELEYRLLPTPGLYLVNKRDNDVNFGTATLLGP